MKKILSLLFMIVFAVVAMAQERTVSIDIKQGFNWGTYVEYTGTAADTLVETNQDSILYSFVYKMENAVDKIAIFCQADTLAGNDSIYYTLTGYNQLPGTGTEITTGGALLNETLDYFELSASDTDSTDLSFRYYNLLLIQDGNNDYDGGAEIEKVGIKIHTK